MFQSCSIKVKASALNGHDYPAAEPTSVPHFNAERCGSATSVENLTGSRNGTGVANLSPGNLPSLTEATAKKSVTGWHRADPKRDSAALSERETHEGKRPGDNLGYGAEVKRIERMDTE